MAAAVESAQEPTNGASTTNNDVNGTNGAEKIGDNYAIHDAKTMQEAGELMIKDESGKEVPFKSLYEGQSGRQLIIFIRHFFCGACEEYCRALAAGLPPKTLASATPPTKLILIGCGQPDCVADYRKRTLSALGSDETYPIYCDPNRKLYEKFGMAYNTKRAYEKSEYITMGITSLVVSSLKNGIMSGSKGLKGGDYKQNGGEYLFEDGQLKWCHRMKTTSDHAEVKELKQVLGL